MRISEFVFVFLTVSAVSASCSRPVHYGQFVRSETCSGNYSFSLDMSDSLSCYDIYIYSRIDGKKQFEGKLPVDVVLVSPSGAEYYESIVIPASQVKTYDAGSSCFHVLYRQSAVPAESGVWNMVLSIPDGQELTGLRGLGIEMERKSR